VLWALGCYVVTSCYVVCGGWGLVWGLVLWGVGFMWVLSAMCYDGSGVLCGEWGAMWGLAVM
jgi:hypothetical protein